MLGDLCGGGSEDAAERGENKVEDVVAEAGGDEQAQDYQGHAHELEDAVGGAGAGDVFDPVLPAGHIHELECVLNGENSEADHYNTNN